MKQLAFHNWLDQVEVHTAEEADLIHLEWNGEYIHFRRLYRQIYQSACEGKAAIWVAEWVDEPVIGQVFVQLSSSRLELADGRERAYIYGFRVKPEFRNAGLGSKILETVEADLILKNFKKATLNVGLDNPSAFRFYQRHGYIVVGNEPGNWTYIDHLGERHEVHEPAWRMEKRLQQDVKNM